MWAWSGSNVWVWPGSYETHSHSRLRRENERVTTEYDELKKKWQPFQVRIVRPHLLIKGCLTHKLIMPRPQDQIDGLEDINQLLNSQTSLAQSEVGGNSCHGYRVLPWLPCY